MDNNKLALFSLMHHDIYAKTDINWDTTDLLLKTKSNTKKNTITDLAQSIEKIVLQSIKNHKDSEISLTLTGGMDSRILLGTLLKHGVKPNCLTFGNPKSSDVIFAKKIADSFNLPFHNVCQQTPTSSWYLDWSRKVVEAGNGAAHIHRVHRFAGITEHHESYKPKVLFTGHMGGEGLRGLSYNNYFFSKVFEEFNLKQQKLEKIVPEVLKTFFFKIQELDLEFIISELKKQNYFKQDKRENEFYILYDLIGKIHHNQDINLFKSIIPNVVPVYLNAEYLNCLFNSSYHFLNKKDGILGRLNNPKAHVTILKKIYPPLLDITLSNGYKPSDYLKGLWYVGPKKIITKKLNKSKYPANFRYDEWFIEFIKNRSTQINASIWKVYDKQSYFSAFESNQHETNEGYWHKFSNPIYFDLLMKNNINLF